MPTAESFQPERLQAALRPALASAEADQGLQAYRAFYGLPEGCEHRLGRLSLGGYELAVQLEASDWSDNSTAHLHEALEGLDERSRDILQQRWLAEEKATLHELAAKYNVSAERIRQLEKSAMNKLKGSIQA